MTTEQRDSHPYHMYDAMLAQPEAFARTIERHRDAVDELASRVASCERIFLAGIGTSHHATLVGEHLMRAYGGGPDVRAVHSFDLALYGPELRQEDCLVAISHRGAKRYTALALEQAREKGCPTALITGEGGSGEGRADAVFRTVAQEMSAAHTVSYTSAVAVLALLAGRLGYHRTGSTTVPGELLQDELPGALRTALGTEEEVAKLAREHVGRRRIWLVGGGPSAVTATETALKIKETSYLQAEGMPTETMLHGPFQCIEADDLFVLIAPSGAARERTLEVAELAEEVGARYLIFGDETTETRPAAVAVPEVPEPFSALTCLVPLQLFTYHLALARGTNPDSFRVDDPRFARADVSGRL
jgi:glucosamine--fructose-6-phosphate aminotransferase (isomerizing)